MAVVLLPIAVTAWRDSGVAVLSCHKCQSTVNYVSDYSCKEMPPLMMKAAEMARKHSRSFILRHKDCPDLRFLTTFT